MSYEPHLLNGSLFESGMKDWDASYDLGCGAEYRTAITAMALSTMKRLERFQYTFWRMKDCFYHIKRAALVFTLASTTFLNSGCNRSGGSDEFSGLMLQSTQVLVPAVTGSSSTVTANSATTSMTMGSRAIILSEEDKKDFAANLSIGGPVESSAIFKGANITDMRFSGPQVMVNWFTSSDENPGVLQVIKYEGTLSANAKIISNQSFELSEASNKFAKEWLSVRS